MKDIINKYHFKCAPELEGLKFIFTVTLYTYLVTINGSTEVVCGGNNDLVGRVTTFLIITCANWLQPTDCGDGIANEFTRTARLALLIMDRDQKDTISRGCPSVAIPAGRRILLGRSVINCMEVIG